MNGRILAAVVAATALCGVAHATHSWNDFHWARTTTSFDLIVVNSTTSDWDGYVLIAISDWSQSSVLNIVEDSSGDTSSKTRRRCPAPAGKIRICNLEYGLNGWLGIAGISIDQNGHILYGYTKLNDSYFALSYYDDPTWKQSVACQELGHNLGLDHQDEDFNNTSLESCMDYQDPPWVSPNAHDYDQLAVIYGHLDTYTTYYDAGSSGGDGGSGGACNAPSGKGCNKGDAGHFAGENGWGISLGRSGQLEAFLRIDPDGTRHLTHVTWALGN